MIVLSGQVRPDPPRIPKDETSRPQLEYFLWESTSMMLGSAACTTVLGSSRLAHARSPNVAASTTLQSIDLSVAVAGLKYCRGRRNGRHDELFRARVYTMV